MSILTVWVEVPRSMAAPLLRHALKEMHIGLGEEIILLQQLERADRAEVERQEEEWKATQARWDAEREEREKADAS